MKIKSEIKIKIVNWDKVVWELSVELLLWTAKIKYPISFEKLVALVAGIILSLGKLGLLVFVSGRNESQNE